MIPLLIAVPFGSAATVTFEGLLGSPDSFYNGNTGVSNSDGWSAGGAFFSNSFTSEADNLAAFGFAFTSWRGWSYSNVSDPSTPGYGNQYASSTGGGSAGPGTPTVAGTPVGTVTGETYAIGFDDGAYFNLPSTMMVTSVDLAATTYTAQSVENGDFFADPFGGPSGNEPDFLRATLTGFSELDALGATTGSLVVDLADYTFADNSNDYIRDFWTTYDLTGLGEAKSVAITYSSTDVGTPVYLALDNLTFEAAAVAVPEPSSLILLAGLVGAASLRRRSRA